MTEDITEQRIEDVLMEGIQFVLSVKPENIVIDQTQLADLGIDSLEQVELLTHIEEQIGIELPSDFEMPVTISLRATIARLNIAFNSSLKINPDSDTEY